MVAEEAVARRPVVRWCDRGDNRTRRHNRERLGLGLCQSRVLWTQENRTQNLGIVSLVSEMGCRMYGCVRVLGSDPGTRVGGICGVGWMPCRVRHEINVNVIV